MGSQTLFLENFEKTLLEIYQNLQQFIKTLDTEKSLLEQNKHEELDGSLATKRIIIESLEQISSQCQNLLSSAHFPFNEPSVLAIISQFPSHKQKGLQELWRNVKELLKTCDKKNLVNGVMITTLKNYNESMLQILTQRPKESVYTKQNTKSNSPVSTREHKA